MDALHDTPQARRPLVPGTALTIGPITVPQLRPGEAEMMPT